MGGHAQRELVPDLPVAKGDERQGKPGEPRQDLKDAAVHELGRCSSLVMRSDFGRGFNSTVGSGEDFVMLDTRTSLDQELVVFWIENCFLEVGAGEGFDCVH